jgi:hypothetical protein
VRSTGWVLLGICGAVLSTAYGCGETTTIATARIFTDASGAAPDTGHDSSTPEAAAPDGATPRDAGGPSTHEAGDADAAVLRDAAPVVDAECEFVASVVGHPLTSRRPNRVLFSPDGRLIVMIVEPVDTGAGGPRPNDLLLVALPSGRVTTLSKGVRDASWLGNTTRLLVRSANAELSIVDLGGQATYIAQKTCDGVAVSDGSRLYVVSDCNGRPGIGVLDAVDLVDELPAYTSYGDVPARPGNVVVSPSGSFVAYVSQSVYDGAPPNGVVHVRDRVHNDQPVGGGPPDAITPMFIDDSALLFQASTLGNVANLPTDIYRYAIGDTVAMRVAGDRNIGFGGYQISPDGRTLLAARWTNSLTPNELYAIRLDGTGESLLAADLYQYQSYLAGPAPFVFTGDGTRVLYGVHSNGGTESLPVAGGPGTLISTGSGFALSPYAERVATLELSENRDKDVLHIGSPSGATDQFKFESKGSISGATFVPSDRGVLFIESTAGDQTQRLQHLSFRDGKLTLLGQWTSTALALSSYNVGSMPPRYPVDPTGCYVVIDSNLPGHEGVSLTLVPSNAAPRD